MCLSKVISLSLSLSLPSKVFYWQSTLSVSCSLHELNDFTAIIAQCTHNSPNCITPDIVPCLLSTLIA